MMVILSLAALAGGIVCGLSGWNTGAVGLLTSHTDYVLYVLMFAVGISVGLHRDIFKKIRQYHFKLLIIPAGIVAGSLAGGLVCAPLTGLSLREAGAIASGLGWYSLSGVTLTSLAGAEIGSLAFLSNLLREICSFFCIPLIARYLNYYTCIAPAAATSEDTTLPMMIRYTNEETVILSVFNGIICSALVPPLISLCYAVL